MEPLVWVRPDQVRAEYPPATLLYQRLVAVDALGEPPGRVPIRHLLGFQLRLEAAFKHLGLAEANRGDWRDREGDARDAPGVGPVAGGGPQDGSRHEHLLPASSPRDGGPRL